MLETGIFPDVKVQAFVARSTFPSQNVQNTGGSDHFLMIRFDGNSMSKKYTPLWREAHLEVKSVSIRHWQISNLINSFLIYVNKEVF